MLEDEIELAGAFGASANSAIDDLLERIMANDNPEQARALLKSLALRYPEESPQALSTLAYYSGMRAALSEEDFRWFRLPGVDQAKLRKERLLQYRRYRELFELEVEATRRQRAAVMALESDWGAMGAYVADAVRLAKSRWMLRFAGTLYAARIPGALDICDAAVFELFRAAYA